MGNVHPLRTLYGVVLFTGFTVIVCFRIFLLDDSAQSRMKSKLYIDAEIEGIHVLEGFDSEDEYEYFREEGMQDAAKKYLRENIPAGATVNSHLEKLGNLITIEINKSCGISNVIICSQRSVSYE